MPIHTFVEAEILAALNVEGAPAPLVDRIKARLALIKKARGTITDDDGKWLVSSGYGHHSKKGFVLLEADGLRHQLTSAKAKEIADMLATAAEAAISDEIVMQLLRKVGITDPQRLGAILLDLRELRQGSRDAVFPNTAAGG